MSGTTGKIATIMHSYVDKYWTGFSPRLRKMVLYYASAGLVFWYAVEKLFLTTQLHLNPVQLVILINVAYIAHFIIDIPSSVLADRWSRNKTLALSLVSAWIAALIGGLANGFWMYVFVAIFWAGASALHGGVADALVYDICKDEGSDETYAVTGNRMNNVFIAAIASALILGGIIAHFGGLRAPYLATLIFFLPSAWQMWTLKEPSFHRKDQHDSSRGHIMESLRTFKRSPQLLFVAVMMVINNGVIAIPLYEFSQLVFANAGLALIGIGIATATTNTILTLLMTGVTIRLQTRAGWLFPIWFVVTALALFAVRFIGHWPLLVALYGVGVAAQAMTSRWLAIGLQQNVASSERAATSSVVGTGSNVAWLAISPLVAIALFRFGPVGGSQVSAAFALVAAVLAAATWLYFRSRFTGLFHKSEAL